VVRYASCVSGATERRSPGFKTKGAKPTSDFAPLKSDPTRTLRKLELRVPFEFKALLAESW
jgi:hypothetical protein